jgi:hypothetical protein
MCAERWRQSNCQQQPRPSARRRGTVDAQLMKLMSFASAGSQTSTNDVPVACVVSGRTPMTNIEVGHGVRSGR